MARPPTSPERSKRGPARAKGKGSRPPQVDDHVTVADEPRRDDEVAVANEPPLDDEAALDDASHQENEGAASDESLQGIAGRLWRKLAAIGQRLPASARTRVPRFTRWRLALLAGIILLVLLWSGVAATSTSIYSATVLVTETRHGIADPGALFDFGDLPPTASIEHKLTLKNDGRLDTYVTIVIFGDIRDFLDIEDAFFNLASGEEREILVKLSVPSTAEPGKRFGGRVVVTRLPWGLPW